MDISDNSKQIQIFLSVIIFGYFGVKIVYGLFFQYYPNKYYYRNIDIATTEKSESTTKNIALNAFIPGMWNNEMCDFVTTIILTSIILVFSYNTSSGIFTLDGSAHPAFILGYLIGLIYPLVYKRYGNFLKEEYSNICTIRYTYLSCLFFLMILIIYLNYTSADITKGNNSKMSLSIYFIIIFLLIFGLLLSKKNSKNYQYVTYYNQNTNGVSCNKKNQTTVQSSGDVINITPQFASFILLFLFCYEPESVNNKFLYIFIYGILLGIVVSGISYYGIEYFLVKMPEKEVSSEEILNSNEVNTPSTIQDNYDNANNNTYNGSEESEKNSTEKTISIIKRILIAFIIAIIIFIIYSSLVKKI
jgi:hypothetical protein